MSGLSEKNNKKLTYILLPMIIGTMCCFSAIFWLYFGGIRGCYPWNCPPKRSFDVLEMGIPESYFPYGTDVGELKKYNLRDDLSDFSHASLGIYTPMHVVYNITAFRQEKYAERDLRAATHGNQLHFLEYDMVDLYIPESTDQYYYQCGEYHAFGHICHFVGKYDEYIISYFTSADAGIEQVDAVVQYLDNRMGKLMRGEKVEDWQEIQGPYWEEWEALDH